MKIQKIFSNIENEEEKLYSVLMTEDEITLFSELHQIRKGIVNLRNKAKKAGYLNKEEIEKFKKFDRDFLKRQNIGNRISDHGYGAGKTTFARRPKTNIGVGSHSKGSGINKKPLDTSVDILPDRRRVTQIYRDGSVKTKEISVGQRELFPDTLSTGKINSNRIRPTKKK